VPAAADDRRITIVSHGPNCLDGLTCAVVASRYFEGRRFEPIFASNREIDECLKQYDPTNPEDEELWITDISWRESATDLHLDSLVSRGLRLFWVDHHRTAIERRSEGHLDVAFTGFVLDETYAASRLLFEYLSARRESSSASRAALESVRALVMLADDVDRWVLAIEGSRRLALTVRAMDQHEAYRALRELGPDARLTESLESAAAKLDAELAATFAVAERSRHTVDVPSRDLKLVVAECDGYAGEVADRWNAELRRAVYALYDHRSGGISLRRTPDCDVDLSRLAASFGGGGHPAASGCPLPPAGKHTSAAISRAFVDALERGVDR
jgi:oligoribonuclease NrnB/cAMP/cGMP phosphodiesterase (DHH superfamily)